MASTFFRHLICIIPIMAPTSTLAITQLSSRECRYLAKEHPEIAGRAALVMAPDEAELLAQAMTLVKSIQRRSERLERTIEAMLPSEIPSRTEVLQARRNAEAREALLQEFGALTSSEVAELAGPRARNRAALANRWRKEGQIFALTHHGQTYFAAFQFGPDGRPLPVIAEVRRAFGDDGEGWPMALWFDTANGWLGGERPVDVLTSDVNQVAEAARREARELIF